MSNELKAWRKYPDEKPENKFGVYLVHCTWHNSHEPDTVDWQGLLHWDKFYNGNPDGEPETEIWGWSPADIEDAEYIEDERFSDLHWIALNDVPFASRPVREEVGVNMREAIKELRSRLITLQVDKISVVHIISKLDSILSLPSGGHPEDECQECGSRNPSWHAPNELWNKVMGSPSGIICPRCFQDKADSMGIITHTVLDLIRPDTAERLGNTVWKSAMRVTGNEQDSYAIRDEFLSLLPPSKTERWTYPLPPSNKQE